MSTDADALFCTHQTRGAGGELLQGRACSRCSLETGGIGAAAFEIVRMVEVGEARGAYLVLFLYLLLAQLSLCFLRWPFPLLQMSESIFGPLCRVISETSDFGRSQRLFLM